MRQLVLLLSLSFAFVALAEDSVRILEMDSHFGSVGGGDLVHIYIEFSIFDRCDPFPCSRFPLVKFGEVVVSGEQSRGVITVITPPHAPGQTQVTVQMGQATATFDDFTYRDMSIGPFTPNYEEIVVPAAVGGAPLAGAFGSMWTSELWITNGGSRRVEFFNGYPRCASGCQGQAFPAIEPGQTVKVEVPNDGVNAAYRYYLQKGGADDVTFSLRIRDLSRGEDNHGTEIPVVRAADFHIDRAMLVNVPIDSRARTGLRVYAIADHRPEVLVRVTITAIDGAEVLASAEMMLRNPPGITGDARALYAKYATLGDLRASFPNLPDGKYRIEVVSLDDPFLHTLYALASVTNNRTQLVTAIASR